MDYRLVGEPTPLKRARRRRRWTLVKAAEAIGVKPGTLSKWEQGQSTPSLEHSMLIITVYHELAMVDLLRRAT